MFFATDQPVLNILTVGLAIIISALILGFLTLLVIVIRKYIEVKKTSKNNLNLVKRFSKNKN